MFVICFGAKKTGSTITFQLISALLEARGFDQTSIPRGAIDHDRVQNFSPGCWANDHDWIEFLASHSSNQHLYAIKFHGSCTALLAALIDQGKVLAVVNTRDPRDTALAMRDAAMRKKKGAFSSLTSPQKVLNATQAGCNRTYDWLRDRALIADYEQVAFDSERFLARVATYLRVDVPSSEEARGMRDRADKASATRNLMRSQRFLHDWTAGQAAFYTELFAAELEKLSAISGASEAGITYPEIHVKKNNWSAYRAHLRCPRLPTRGVPVYSLVHCTQLGSIWGALKPHSMKTGHSRFHQRKFGAIVILNHDFCP